MKYYTFRIEVDKTLRDTLSKSLDLISYERGVDFKTRDCAYYIEMKSRRIERENQKAHFSIKSKQYQKYAESTKYSVLSNNDSQPIIIPSLLFMLLEYRTKIPVSEIDKSLIRENIDLDFAYLVDQKVLRRFETPNSFMNVTTKKLDELADEFGIEPMVIRRLNLPVLPLGKNSKTFLKRYS